ncbi:MAG TPA: 16S rRNA (adenine(1518)-N(6)/adenine(1519)-N(6))-dimethyltransferase RsmA [Gammaproteobacteria bacterium]|nr:16S rRNA (adenine(1518)-N(6)/adenine(1519)-N(6))-dimethyltransferase RsmA [Gammaproteobacteria bacterium]
MTHRPRKRFGQNFLHDPTVIERMLTAIAPARGEDFVEIGPGRGALTTPLAEAVGRLTVIELDRDLAGALAGDARLRVIQADALSVALDELRAGEPPLRVVGNLPYNISTPLLFHVSAFPDAVGDMHFLLQKEVVERMAAGPGSHAYGRLSVMIQLRCAVEALFDVPARAFHPAPKITSRFVRLVPHATPPVRVRDEHLFAMLVARAFSQRRKTLRNSLRGLLTAAEIEAAGVDPMQRPERLSLQEFADLAAHCPT